MLPRDSKCWPGDEGSKSGSSALKILAEKCKSMKMENERESVFLCDIRLQLGLEFAENVTLYSCLTLANGILNMIITNEVKLPFC